MKDWNEMREQGKATYIVKHGVLFWGLLTALIWSLAMHYFQPQDPIWIRPLIAAVVFPICGYFLGLISWKRNEKKHYEKDTADRS